MQFTTIFVTLISIASALPIDLHPADGHAAAAGDEYSRQLMRLNHKYTREAEQVGVTSSAFSAMSNAIIKCNIGSALQMASKLSLDASNASKLKKIQSNYNTDVTKLKSEFGIASCSK